MNGSDSVGFVGVERDHVRPLLKRLGFRKRALVFTRDRGGLTDVVSLQRSSGNSGGHVRFYVNCGIYSAEFATAIGDTASARPREVDCQFRCRLEKLVPGMPPWFEITDDEAAAAVGAEVSAGLEAGAGALGLVTTTDQVADRISGGVATEAFRYRIATGDWDSARRLYGSIRLEFGAEERWPRIDAVLRRHIPEAELDSILSPVPPA